MTTATVPEAGIASVGVPSRSGWVAATRSSPARRSRRSPSGARTSIEERVTGAVKALVTSRSYSRWSAPSLPGARSGSFVAATTMRRGRAAAAGEATGVAWLPTTGVGAAAVARSPPSAATRANRDLNIAHLR